MQKSSFLKNIQFRVLDLLILIIFIGVLALSILDLNSSKSKKASIIITTPFDEYVYPLDKDREIKIKGLIGITTIKIENGSVRFEDSPCPNKTCVACAPIRENMEWIACLPNQVFARIEKDTEQNKNQTDASTF